MVLGVGSSFAPQPTRPSSRTWKVKEVVRSLGVNARRPAWMSSTLITSPAVTAVACSRSWPLAGWVSILTA
jgi:hypothetical protein